MYVFRTFSAEETESLGEKLGSFLDPGDVLCLYGDLGAGKTVFARGVARGLGIENHVTSPTFTLINEYQGRLPLYHMDVFRLCSPQEMEDLGYEEYLYGSGVTLVEWADIVLQILPHERLDITIARSQEGDDSREITLAPLGDRYRRLVEELMAVVHPGH
ncbi:tRNA (adenosine(37)-N6)-threonylcarbamoyltransferase complex ATPase subunit type 1 TsaE [Pelotomaculum propionicicum]|uniref:tRNA threonylcarbamoyladenosine biosynthesis protein TsaE n=1 Tax=Pelotomaculum propionicicum TaxID=258475 RepID=A0A4Y7RRJ9_9FIRM|nr:tRNA (adenosine(37)-N6)-threonylcarbamoyltransferase complex ATPase subunit type 1 TsaE [Pelotomaculum propionicicum]NLI14263.1 tRNA (adenosine(37)-N6)-threonylcarbamoyltransferase complex ATPase subunit type 1 TsaE [Peptococcaceae bacterium]TEB11471.1 tRNA threonylcarbamoyladenosine biosynthesis protein TsaE [Pelotomaculum propionicicum]